MNRITRLQRPASRRPLVAKPRQRGVVDFKSCAKTAWPEASRSARQAGRITLAYLVDVAGNVHDSWVRKSRRHPALDEAPRDGIAKCSFHAGRQDGEPVKSWVMQSVWSLS